MAEGPTCLDCARTLHAVTGPFGTPPWGCKVCRRAWWPAELTDDARANWRTRFKDFGPKTTTIAAAVKAEIQA